MSREESRVKTYITDYLDSRNVSYHIKLHKRPVFTSEDAARERGVRLSQIVKTMLLKDKEGCTLVAVLPGHKRLDLKKLRKISGQKSLDFMDRKAIEKQFGVVVGALAPFGPPVEGVPVFIDNLVFKESAVDISSGDPTAGIELMRDDFRRLLKHATVAEITKAN